MSFVYEKQVVETLAVTDVVCDSCGMSCKRPLNFEYGMLTASWGYDSAKDMVNENHVLCETCFDTIANTFIKKRFPEE